MALTTSITKVAKAVLSPTAPKTVGDEIIYGQLEADLRHGNSDRKLAFVVGFAFLILGIWNPTLNRDRSFSWHITAYVIGLAFGGGTALYASYELSKREERLRELEAAKADIRSEILGATHMAQKAREEILAEIGIAKEINALIPPHLQHIIAKKKGVEWAFVPEPRPEPEITIEAKTIGGQKTLAQIREERAGNYDLTWLTPGFIAAAKVIAGKPGSGKTTVLDYVSSEFAYQFPDGTLRIGDIHYLDTKKNGRYKWLNSCEDDLKTAGYLYTDPKEVYEIWQEMEAVLEERKTKRWQIDSNPPPPMYHFICEEFQGFLDEFHQEQGIVKNVLRIFKKVNGREGRKYNVGCTLVLHSLKKEETQLDIGDILAGAMLLTGKALIEDPTIQFPRSFKPNVLCQEATDLDSALKGQKARAAIYKPSPIEMNENIPEDPHVVVLPILEPPPVTVSTQQEVQDGGTLDVDAVNLDQQEEDIYAQILQALPKECRHQPTDNQLALAFYQATGQEATPEGIRMVREALFGGGDESSTDPRMAA